MAEPLDVLDDWINETLAALDQIIADEVADLGWSLEDIPTGQDFLPSTIWDGKPETEDDTTTKSDG